MKIPRTHTSHLATAFLLVGFAVLSYVGLPRVVNAQEKNEAAKAGATFKVPDGFMQVQMNGFRGAMMLDPKKPVVIFVTYPNDNETTDALRERVLKFSFPMFMHDEKVKKDTEIVWAAKSLPAHPGDGDGKAVASVYAGEKQELQVVIYERKGPRPFLYGYFATRHKKPNGDDGKFLDDQGQGVKAFDKLWQSFPR